MRTSFADTKIKKLLNEEQRAFNYLRLEDPGNLSISFSPFLLAPQKLANSQLNFS